MLGKSLAASIRATLKERVAALVQRGVKLGLAVVLAGDDPASRVNVRNKRLAVTETGVHSELGESSFRGQSDSGSCESALRI